MDIRRPQVVTLELEDLPDTHAAIPEYIQKLEDAKNTYLQELQSRYQRVKKLEQNNGKLIALLMQCQRSLDPFDNKKLIAMIDAALGR